MAGVGRTDAGADDNDVPRKINKGHNHRKRILRLNFFLFVLFAYGGFSVIFSSTKSTPRDVVIDDSPMRLLDDHQVSIGNQSSKEVLNATERILNDERGEVQNVTEKVAHDAREEAVQNNNSSAPPSLESGTTQESVINETLLLLDESTLSMQKALAALATRDKAELHEKGDAGQQNSNTTASTRNTRPLRGAAEKRRPATGKDALDKSPFNATELHQSLLSFYTEENTVWDGRASTTTENGTSSHFLWDEPQSKLPEWMKRYLRWHHRMRSRVVVDPASSVAGNATTTTSDNRTASNAPPLKFIVMQCLTIDSHCGGVSDRLKPLPLILRIAYYTKRVLLIHWNRPGHLEEFLLPPRGGIDWRVPQWMVPQILNHRRFGKFTYKESEMREWARTGVPLVRTRYQNYHGGSYVYDEDLVEGEVDFAGIFHDLWRVFFTPSPPVRAVLESDMQRLGLVPGEYVAAHLRALYAIQNRNGGVQRNWARNAMNCATELRPRKTIFFVSDSAKATEFAREYGAEQNATVITRTPNPNPPFHMDKVKDWRNRSISDFYDSFIDIYIMGHADCLTYNKGGFGRLGLFLSRNSSCGVRQDAMGRPKIKNPCFWVDDPQNGTQVTRDSRPANPLVSNDFIYVDHMDE